MKKQNRIIALIIIIISFSSLTNSNAIQSDSQKSLEPVYNYESVSRFYFGDSHLGQLCLETSCTSTSGSDCTTPGSTFKYCGQGL